jgi:hypothetical protein
LEVQKDHFFTIGTFHQADGLPCQDYAFSGTTPNNIHYAIVSDGCSASNDSDLGSRWLTHWFRSFLEAYPDNFPADPSKYGEMQVEALIEDFRVGVREDNLLPHGQCTDATLVAAFLHRAFDLGYILMVGDGAFAIRDRDGSLRSYLVEVDGNFPPYLSYQCDNNRLAQYLNVVRARELKMNITEYDSETKILKVFDSVPLESVIASAGVIFEFDPKTTDMVGIFTDGVHSFEQKWYEMTEKLMDVKTFEGNFVTRTCLGNLRRMTKQGAHHYDDLSMAAMKINHPEESLVNGNKTTTEDGVQTPDVTPE